MTRREANERMIQQRVRVIGPDFVWIGKILSLKDDETFLVESEENGETHEVSVFDVRSM